MAASKRSLQAAACLLAKACVASFSKLDSTIRPHHAMQAHLACSKLLLLCIAAVNTACMQYIAFHSIALLAMQAHAASCMLLLASMRRMHACYAKHDAPSALLAMQAHLPCRQLLLLAMYAPQCYTLLAMLSIAKALAGLLHAKAAQAKGISCLYSQPSYHQHAAPLSCAC